MEKYTQNVGRKLEGTSPLRRPRSRWRDSCSLFLCYL